MAPRRQLTDAEKAKKNRKQRERRAQEDPQTKAKRNEENRARATYVRENKKRALQQEPIQGGARENADEVAEPAKRQCQTATEDDRRARLDTESAKRRECRARESKEVYQVRLRDQALRQQSLRVEENEEERRVRQIRDIERHRAKRIEETAEERTLRAMADRLRHQMYLVEETEEEAEIRRELNREQTANYRAAEIEEEREERREESQSRMERLREEREEDEELLRAMNAFEHAEIIPLETEEERTFREELLAACNRARVPRTHRAACKTLASDDRVPLHDCGEMTVNCGECNARHFKGEQPTDKKFTQCCAKGKVILPPPKECPQPLVKLLQNDHPKAKAFMTKIRNYNSAHAFASLGANISSPPGRGPYCFRIHGQVYHNTTPVGPHTNNPRYADLYFMDAAQAGEFRALSTSNGGCCRNLMEELDAMLREKNPNAAIYKMMRQVLIEEYRRAQDENLPHQTVGMIISSDRRNLDQRRYNSPTTNEIAVIFKSANGEPPAKRDIRGHLFIPVRGRTFVQIDTQQPMCDPMTYPLLFPNGDDCWHVNMPYTTTTRREREEAAARAMDVDEEEKIDLPRLDEMLRLENAPLEALAGEEELLEEPEPEPEEQMDEDDNDPQRLNRGEGRRKRITQCEFYSFLMSIREYFNNVLAGGSLTQQWTVDSYVKIEANRVKYIREHQAELHVERHCLRLLLINVKGPTSFEDLRHCLG
ncbi:uncharacterized protein LOC116926850 [Daphnia magna]|uniref:uncharacterized protein LOC116926850 n=1 Tax=Daphnia magna TaxID=35525 RepID=UPI001E1BDA88|nr:uncharacterized protein LOC116926850 [Daphnia magna]